LKFADPRVMALMQAIILFFLLPRGFTNASLKGQVARLMGKDPATYKSGQMTYDLRRLRLHGLIERVPHSHRYQVTQKGMKVSLFYAKVYGRVLRGGLSQLFDGLDFQGDRKMVAAIRKVETAIEEHIQCAKLAA